MHYPLRRHGHRARCQARFEVLYTEEVGMGRLFDHTVDSMQPLHRSEPLLINTIVQLMSVGILAVIYARLSYDGNVHIWDQRPETAVTSSLVSLPASSTDIRVAQYFHHCLHSLTAAAKEKRA